VQAFCWTGTPPPGISQIGVGLDATGKCYTTGLVLGQPVHVELGDEIMEYFIAQAKVLWGVAWSPLP
jgi:hypothetical protein